MPPAPTDVHGVQCPAGHARMQVGTWAALPPALLRPPRTGRFVEWRFPLAALKGDIPLASPPSIPKAPPWTTLTPWCDTWYRCTQLQTLKTFCVCLRFILQDAPLEGADPVVWYSFGVTHVVRPEDFPIMPVEVGHGWGTCISSRSQNVVCVCGAHGCW